MELGDIHGPKPYKFIGFGEIHGPKPSYLLWKRWVFAGTGSVSRPRAKLPELVWADVDRKPN